MLLTYRTVLLVVILMFYVSTSVSASGASFRINALTTGLSSWVFFPKHREAYSAYNKLAFDGYFSYGKFTGFLGLPFQYTLDKRDYVSINGKRVPGDTLLGEFACGDLSMYIGYRLGKLEPRIGLIFPLGYKTNTGVWLGSKNVILKTGAGFSGDLNKKLKLRYGGELYFKYYIGGYPEIDGALGKKGSWSIDPDLKVTMQTSKKWKIGVETLGGYRKLYPKWLKKGSFQGYELSCSLVPHFIASYDMSYKSYISGKIGLGPSFKKSVESVVSGDTPMKHTGNSFNIGISAGFYP